MNNGRYSPHTNGKEPTWDNSNHLQEELKRREEDAFEASQFNWDDFQPSDEECPF
ncbi:hypothetical protein [uncultured Parabacteroides sp.]|uniref:hypothetical protein n=1 Tax=uncultured Parabacteroides sp. TaxID=512312 RepID=UPI0026DB668E|nr:hypothetical protein [uncultured Parabacteroides sp.]